MNYNLGEYQHPYFVFRFDDGRWAKINLAEDYPKYRLPKNNLNDDEWHFTAIENKYRKKTELGYNLGDIRLFKYKELRKYNTIIKRHRSSGVLYKVSNQTELDSYEYRQNLNTDNAKVYKKLIAMMTDDIETQYSVNYMVTEV